MGLHVLDFIATVGNPAKQFLWNVIIPGLPTAIIRAQSSQFPSVGSTEMELFYMGQPIKYAGAVEYEHTWTVTIVEGEVGDIYTALYAWRQLIWDQNTAMGQSPTVYKKEVTVQALTHQNVPWLSAILHNAWPKTIDAVDLDRSANTETWKWNVTFSFDWWSKA